ncbi:hypothetical protein [Trebonia sp.]|uniref:hypothetical protein n=1 Tax=Trebonia sp. TaxID=2767075 RepID=UPI00260161B8|nr:hypothetical protein [Trebonia sp.]
MWSGPVTAFLSNIIQEGRQLGIPVTVQERKYSLQQLRAAIAAVWEQAANGEWAGFNISAIAAISATEDGLTVDGQYTSSSAVTRAPQVRTLSTSVLGIPVHIDPGVVYTPTGTRDSDVSPFNAGDYMVSQSTGDTCSTGFAIEIGGVDYTETARHCDHADFVARDDYGESAPADQQYGTTLELSSDGGARVLTGNGFPWMFNHGYNSSTTSVVIGYGNVGLNDLVCTEGGNSGEHCNVEVTNMLVSLNDGYGNPFETIQGTQETVGAIAVMQGDSGGPVMTLTNTETGEVNAAGMIQAGNDEVGTGAADCGPAYDYGSNICYTNVLFSSELTIVNSIEGASLVTG